MLEFLAIGIAGGIGACSRFCLDNLLSEYVKTKLPLGTIVVNVSGSLLIGIAVGFMSSELLNERYGAIITFGFLGAYTTFSTWIYESALLIKEGKASAAAANVAISLLAGVACAAGGLYLFAI